MSKKYRLFISHSWAYGDKYDKVIEFLEKEKIEFYDHSVPKNDPVHTSGCDWELQDAIDAKIKGVSCVLILAGVYSSYSKWIKKKLILPINMRNLLSLLNLGMQREHHKL